MIVSTCRVHGRERSSSGQLRKLLINILYLMREDKETLHTRSDSDTHGYVARHLPAVFWFYKSGQKSANGYHCTLCEITHSCQFHPLIVTTVNFCSSIFFQGRELDNGCILGDQNVFFFNDRNQTSTKMGNFTAEASDIITSSTQFSRLSSAILAVSNDKNSPFELDHPLTHCHYLLFDLSKNEIIICLGSNYNVIIIICLGSNYDVIINRYCKPTFIHVQENFNEVGKLLTINISFNIYCYSNC